MQFKNTANEIYETTFSDGLERTNFARFTNLSCTEIADTPWSSVMSFGFDALTTRVRLSSTYVHAHHPRVHCHFWLGLSLAINSRISSLPRNRIRSVKVSISWLLTSLDRDRRENLDNVALKHFLLHFARPQYPWDLSCFVFSLDSEQVFPVWSD